MNSRAVLIENFEDQPHVGELVVPELGPTQVLVRVAAAGMNAFDWKLADGVFRNGFDYQFPVTIGRDYSGVVEAIGDRVERVAVGDAVFGYFVSQALKRGSYADYVWVDQDECFVRKPDALDHRTAACLPLAGVVAMRCVNTIAPREDDKVLVIGAPGGVGSFAVQIAAHAGARVIATGLPEDEDYLKDLGATEVVAPGDSLIVELSARHPDGLAGVVDLVHFSEAFNEHLALLAPGGRAASTHRGVNPDLFAERGLTGTNVFSGPDPRLLAELGDLAAAGDLKVPVASVFDLDDAPDALRMLKEAHTRGKLVIGLDSVPGARAENAT